MSAPARHWPFARPGRGPALRPRALHRSRAAPGNRDRASSRCSPGATTAGGRARCGSATRVRHPGWSSAASSFGHRGGRSNSSTARRARGKRNRSRTSGRTNHASGSTSTTVRFFCARLLCSQTWRAGDRVVAAVSTDASQQACVPARRHQRARPACLDDRASPGAELEAGRGRDAGQEAPGYTNSMPANGLTLNVTTKCARGRVVLRLRTRAWNQLSWPDSGG